MAYDVSATGFSLTVTADKTFAQGFLCTAFADDADPFDLPQATVAEVAMNANGELVTWSSPQPQEVTINVLPGTDEDKNLMALLDANTARKGRRAAGDIITMVASYGDGATMTARNGKITQGSRGMGVASAGRHKSKAYTFAFQDFDYSR